MSDKNSYFASKLRELRAAAELSQSVLSERSGVPVSDFRQFEYGRREPTYVTLLKLAEGLGVSLSAFDKPTAAAEAPKRGKGKPK